MQHFPNQCPTCGNSLHVTGLVCSHCDTNVSGQFSSGLFSALTEEQMFFLVTFIRLRGSLKEVGAALEISYPTARNRLDQVITTLGYQDVRNEQARRLEILEKIKEGILSVEIGIKLLEGGR